MLHIAVYLNTFEVLFELYLQVVAQGGKAPRFFRHFVHGDLTSFAEADNSRHVECSGAHTVLVASAIHLSCDLDPRTLTSHIQRSCALRAIKLVGSDGH